MQHALPTKFPAPRPADAEAAPAGPPPDDAALRPIGVARPILAADRRAEPLDGFSCPIDVSTFSHLLASHPPRLSYADAAPETDRLDPVVEACRDAAQLPEIRFVVVIDVAANVKALQFDSATLEDAEIAAAVHAAAHAGLAAVLDGREQEETPFGDDGCRLLALPIDPAHPSSGACAAVIDATADADLAEARARVRRVAEFAMVCRENRRMQQEGRLMLSGLLRALVTAVDAKDAYTCGHSLRVALYARRLAETAGLDGEALDRVYLAGLLHDVGKIGVDDSVLRKPGRLSEAEFDQIRQHPAIGHDILSSIPQVQDVLPGVLHHHERYDGRGYPHGLAGEQIPLMARVLAVADSFDAMTSDRNYRSASSAVAALAEIARCAGSQFDPRLAKLFCRLPVDELEAAIARDRAAHAPPTAMAA